MKTEVILVRTIANGRRRIRLAIRRDHRGLAVLLTEKEATLISEEIATLVQAKGSRLSSFQVEREKEDR